MRTTVRPALVLTWFLALATAGSCSAPGTSPAVGPGRRPATSSRRRRPSSRRPTSPSARRRPIDLCSNPTTGYAWEAPTVADPAVAEVVSSTYEAPAAASPPVVGAAGRQVVTIKGLAAGTTTVAMKYGQPWAGGQKGAWTYQLTVTVP